MTQSDKPSPAAAARAERAPAAQSPGGAPSSDAAPTSTSQDIALIHGRTEDGAGLKVLRQRNDCLEAGVIRPLVEGQAINGEVVRLEPRKGFPLLCDVHVEVDARPAAGRADRSARHGPSQVATDTYRKNWDAIYNRRRDDDDFVN